MGFGNDPDKLVVITDGAKDMNLVAFWRNNITPGSNRIAGQIPVTCGFSPLPEWIQSEQSVVVYGYGAFVVNNIPETVSSDLIGQNKILQVSLMGPAYPTSYGAERFQWNPLKHEWSSVWTRPDVSSTSMVPVNSQSSNMALINGYNNSTGWEVLGLDWTTGKTVHQTIFGNKNFGNGAYAILEYLENEDLIFNSIVGPIRVHYDMNPVASGGKGYCGQEKGFTAKFKSTDQINEDENMCHTKNIKEKKEYEWHDKNIDEHAMIYKPIYSSIQNEEKCGSNP
jgi:hypothetical protein